MSRDGQSLNLFDGNYLITSNIIRQQTRAMQARRDFSRSHFRRRSPEAIICDRNGSSDASSRIAASGFLKRVVEDLDRGQKIGFLDNKRRREANHAFMRLLGQNAAPHHR